MAQLLNSTVRVLLRHPAHFPPLGRCVKNLGFFNYRKLVADQDALANRRPSEAIVWLRSRYAKFPLACRPGTSDFRVFEQIFIDREYSCLDGLRDLRCIIDCGANVGYSTAYFLTRFPGAKVTSVEPDDSNFEQLKLNAAPYGDRVKLIKSGLWSHAAQLRMVESPYRDGGAWTRQVTECAPGETGFRAIDLNELVARYHPARIGLLKIDIEGAEAVVFASNYKTWLSQVDTLVIELHDDTMFGDGRSLVKLVMRQEGFSETEFAELSVFRRNG